MKVQSALFVLSLFALFSCNPSIEEDRPHIVFVTGDEEYRSEESMPMLGAILARDLNAKISICYSVNEQGFIDPNRVDTIAGLEALADADLMVMFTRFRALSQRQLKMITDYAESGKPMVGFRTSTHAFLYEDKPELEVMNNDWPTKVFGQQWITHHGHFDDGHEKLTSVAPLPESNHIVLTDVEAFEAFSWLYHVDGGKWELYGDSEPLALGTSLKSNHAENNRLDEYPIQNPVAWTKSYRTSSDQTTRVFFTTLGHPYDFKVSSMRRLALNGILWALGREEVIKSGQVTTDFAGPYDPNNAGFGQLFKKNQRPTQIDE